MIKLDKDCPVKFCLEGNRPALYKGTINHKCVCASRARVLENC